MHPIPPDSNTFSQLGRILGLYSVANAVMHIVQLTVERGGMMYPDLRICLVVFSFQNTVFIIFSKIEDAF
jgi:hypothetical protein